MSLARYYLQNVDLWPSGMQRSVMQFSLIKENILILKIFRRSIAVNLLDLLVICQNMLYSRFAHSPLIEGVIAIKNELDKIIKN